MSKKHYIRIAKILRKSRRELERMVSRDTLFQSVVLPLADYLKEDNDRFDRARFMDYIYQK